MADQTPPITPNPKKRGATSSGPKPPDEQNVARVAKLLDFDITEEFAEVLRKVGCADSMSFEPFHLTCSRLPSRSRR